MLICGSWVLVPRVSLYLTINYVQGFVSKVQGLLINSASSCKGKRLTKICEFYLKTQTFPNLQQFLRILIVILSNIKIFRFCCAQNHGRAVRIETREAIYHTIGFVDFLPSIEDAWVLILSSCLRFHWEPNQLYRKMINFTHLYPLKNRNFNKSSNFFPSIEEAWYFQLWNFH